MLVVRQQLLGHLRMTMSRLGPGQRCTEDGRVPLGDYPTLLQQEKHHIGGRRQIHHHVLQEGTQGLVLDPEARHEEPHDVGGDVGHCQQVCSDEEATLNTRDQKDKELSHSNQPNTSKSNDKKRKSDTSVANIERPRCNKEYWPRSRKFEGFLDEICIFHLHGKHKA
jgi:hypothetical protein